MPRVSILMPVYNGERFIKESVQSIVQQTFRDFELIVVDDGSTDASASVAESFGDRRIKVVRNEKNKGLVGVRNQCLSLAASPYVGWLDADDIAHRKRLEIEIKFLDTHPHIGLVGTWTELIDENGGELHVVWKDHITPEKMPSALLFHNRFTQSSVLIRRQALPKDAYREGLAPSEDYDLWIRISENWKCLNIPNILTKYRKHSEGASARDHIKRSAVEKIQRERLAKLCLQPSEKEYQVHRTNYYYDGSDLENFLALREGWLLKLLGANVSTKVYPQKEFTEVVAEQWLLSCAANTGRSVHTWKRFWASELAQYTPKKAHWRTFTRLALHTLLHVPKVR